MAAAWTLTVRHGPRVERGRHPTLDDALDALGARLDELAPQVAREPVDFLGRRFDPVRQVAARAEIAGPGRLARIHGGVDLRGDGSTEPWVGRWRRSLVSLEPGETAYSALRRALDARGGVSS